MWHFVFGSAFTKSTKKVADKEMSRMWKQLNQLERDDVPKGLNIEPLKSNKGLFSLRVSKGFRLIFARHPESKLIQLLYLGQHDDSYRFAEGLKSDALKLPFAVMGAAVILQPSSPKHGIYEWTEELISVPSANADGAVGAEALFHYLRPGMALIEDVVE